MIVPGRLIVFNVAEQAFYFPTGHFPLAECLQKAICTDTELIAFSGCWYGLEWRDMKFAVYVSAYHPEMGR